jgi:hypothetical protein
MDRLGARALDRVDQFLDDQVALGGGTGAEQKRLVGTMDEGRVATPNSSHARMILTAISPRLAIRIFENMKRRVTLALRA